MILHSYFLRRFLFSFAWIFTVFLVLLALIDLVDELQDFPNLAFGQVLTIVALAMPEENYEILPLIVILATIAMFMRAARASELVVVRAAGRSALMQLLAPVVGAMFIGFLAVAVGNPIVATTAKRYNDLINLYENRSLKVLATAEDGLWLRQAEDNGHIVIHAISANETLTELKNVSFHIYSTDGDLLSRLNAQSAQLTSGAWQLRDVKEWNLNTENNPEDTALLHEEFSVATDLTQDRIEDSFGKPEFISIWAMPEFMADLEEAGFSPRRYEAWFHSELAKPLFLVALVLISASFTMQHVRSGNTGISVLSAIMFGFGLHYIRNFALILGENGQISVHLAAWSPPVAALFLALGIILHKEDG